MQACYGSFKEYTRFDKCESLLGLLTCTPVFEIGKKKNSSAGYSSDRKSVIELMFKYNLIQNALQISLLPR